MQALHALLRLSPHPPLRAIPHALLRLSPHPPPHAIPHALLRLSPHPPPHAIPHALLRLSLHPLPRASPHALLCLRRHPLPRASPHALLCPRPKCKKKGRQTTKEAYPLASEHRSCTSSRCAICLSPERALGYRFGSSSKAVHASVRAPMPIKDTASLNKMSGPFLDCG